MEIPSLNEALLKMIEPKSLHCDKKSKEKFTGVVKTKYKLFAAKILPPLNFYLFFVLTSKIDACQRSFTIKIPFKDWEIIKSGYLAPVDSYLDYRKIEHLTEDDVLAKMNDSGNKFVRIAKLPDEKFEEIKKEYQIRKAKGFYMKASPETKELIDSALLGANIESRVLERLGL